MEVTLVISLIQRSREKTRLDRKKINFLEPSQTKPSPSTARHHSHTHTLTSLSAPLVRPLAPSSTPCSAARSRLQGSRPTPLSTNSSGRRRHGQKG